MKWLAVLAVLLFTSGAASAGSGLTIDQFQARQINTLKDEVRGLKLAVQCLGTNGTWISIETRDGEDYVVPSSADDPNGSQVPVITQSAACTGR